MFKNILVGVDLARCNPLETAALPGAALEMIDRALWLADRFTARLEFFSAFNLKEDALHALTTDERTHLMTSIEKKALNVLDDLVHRARTKGVTAGRSFSLGRPWQEIIRAVLGGNHDLVVVGTRDLTGFRRMLYGNTALKLLRGCPCPVWVVKHGMRTSPLNILIAADFKATALIKINLGIALAKRLDANLHILHVVEYPLDRLAFVDLESEMTDRYHQKIRDDAQDLLMSTLEKTAYRDLGSRCQIHIDEGIILPDLAIQHCVAAYDIDLLLIGTIGRGGLAGALIGNTAERLLPELQCSVLAVKPPDFHCPVQLNH